MAVKIENKERRVEMVTSIEIRIGDEHATHHFGRRVPMHHARAWAQHYLDVFTGQPRTFQAGDPPASESTTS